MNLINVAVPFALAVFMALMTMRDNPKLLSTMVTLYCGVAFGMAMAALLIARHLDQDYVSNVLYYAIFMAIMIIATGFTFNAFSGANEQDERL